VVGGIFLMVETRTDRFAGTVMVYGKPIFIDTSDGTGFIEILDRMSIFLNGFGKWSCTDPSIDSGDLQQDARVAALEGILDYRHDRSVQLSTFLHRYVKNRMVDASRKRRILQVPLCEAAEAIVSHELDPEDRIDLMRMIENWNVRWKRIMFRIYIRRDKIRDVAADEEMSPWGLTRAIRRKIKSSS